MLSQSRYTMELISLVAFYILQCWVCNVKLHPLLTYVCVWVGVCTCVCVYWAVLEDCMCCDCRVEAVTRAVVHLLVRSIHLWAIHIQDARPLSFGGQGHWVDEGCGFLPRCLGSWWLWFEVSDREMRWEGQKTKEMPAISLKKLAFQVCGYLTSFSCSESMATSWASVVMRRVGVPRD